MSTEQEQKAQGRRLRIARLAAGYRSGRAAAVENGWPESTYSAHERGTRTIGQDDAERYARRFRDLGAKVTGKEILYGAEAASSSSRPPKGTPEFVQVPILSRVTAGRFADQAVPLPFEDVPLMAFADLGRGDFFGLQVEGDSMDRISPNGSIIVVNRAERTLVPGKPYVFAHRGETTYKLWHGGDPSYLQPHSFNPANDPIFVKKKRDLEVIGRVRRTVLDL